MKAGCEAGGVGVRRDLEGESLNSLARDLLILVDGGSVMRVRVGVHRRYARVVLVGNKVAVMWETGGPLKHLHAWMLLRMRLLRLLLLMMMVRSLAVERTMILRWPARRQTVSVIVLLLQVVALHVLAKVGERSSSLEVVTVRTQHGYVVVLWPSHGRVALWC